MWGLLSNASLLVEKFELLISLSPAEIVKQCVRKLLRLKSVQGKGSCVGDQVQSLNDLWLHTEELWDMFLTVIFKKSVEIFVSFSENFQRLRIRSDPV